ncbi:MAG: serine/threonine protein kinase [Phycisphaerae bacterium]|nr:serine/threonine protein kinase [Phycisphaerae bacterium]
MNEQAPENSIHNEPPVPAIPDYELLRPIGEGGFGRVWLATNRITGHLRAVKVIPLQGPAGTGAAGREIMSITRLEASMRSQAANLLHIHHVGKTDTYLFYVMDLADDVTGCPPSNDPDYLPATLKNRLARAPLTPETCLVYARQLVTALASLHSTGMVHRDVKPSNCLFIDGELKLADFGLLTQSHTLVSQMGTHGYMPPDGRMNMRADVYAAGLVIYEMVTGLPADSFPHLGKQAGHIAANPMLRQLIRLTLEACQGDPQERPEDADQLLSELNCIGEVCESPVPGHRKRVLFAAVSLAIVLIGIITSILWVPRANKRINFITEAPFFEATITLDGQRLETPDGTPYTTPCTIAHLKSGVHHVIFKHPQKGDLDLGYVDFAKTRQIIGRWPSESPP